MFFLFFPAGCISTEFPFLVWHLPSCFWGYGGFPNTLLLHRASSYHYTLLHRNSPRQIRQRFEVALRGSETQKIVRLLWNFEGKTINKRNSHCLFDPRRYDATSRLDMPRVETRRAASRPFPSRSPTERCRPRRVTPRRDMTRAVMR